MIYPDIFEESFLSFSLWIGDSGVEDYALDLVTWEIILVNDLVIGKKIYLGLVEFLTRKDLLSCDDKVVERLWCVRCTVEIDQEGNGLFWR